MTKDRSGRRVYRKSPGRPCGYGGLELAPRPDPRRTRQLMRQSILASKARTALYGEQEDEVQDQQAEQHESEEQEESTPYGNRESRSSHPARPRTPSQALYRTGKLDREAGEAELEEPDSVNPIGGEE